ncbi:hypothetical protein [Sphingopyxis sp. PET50]|uniref:hypothetical protein n=1 Tax=Sphingopyxis sp. PET50 TaxID=2976533 RepID=UPI0021AFB966|nr:hypothetical protein [Sphingopyxis sp. PET50]
MPGTGMITMSPGAPGSAAGCVTRLASAIIHQAMGLARLRQASRSSRSPSLARCRVATVTVAGSGRICGAT